MDLIKGPYHTAFDAKPQFETTTWLTGNPVPPPEKCLTPFVNFVFEAKGWKDAWRVLTRGMTFNASVYGTREAIRVIERGNYARENGSIPGMPGRDDPELTAMLAEQDKQAVS